MTGALAGRPRTVAKMIAEELRGQILAGTIPAGSRLQQNDVATQFGVSSTPVREAFGELTRQGLVAASEHRGVRVFRPTLTDVVDSSQVLELLEGTAITASVPLLSDADLAQAQRLFDEHRAVPANQWPHRLELDTAFHLSLVIRCPNKKLRDLTEQAHRDSVVYKLMFSSIEGEELMPTIYEQHEAILTACMNRNAKAAKARTIDHIRWGLQISRNVLEASSPPSS
jgi:DNA-binding GntR family transcriptional regulator